MPNGFFPPPSSRPPEEFDDSGAQNNVGGCITPRRKLCLGSGEKCCFWLFLHRFEKNDTVRQALQATRKIVFVLVIVPAVLLVFVHGMHSSFDAHQVADDLIESLQVKQHTNAEIKTGSINEKPRVAQSTNPNRDKPPKTKAEMVESFSSFLRFFYWFGVFLGLLYLGIQWVVLEPQRMDKNNEFN